MTRRSDPPDVPPEPVYVIEAIPVPGEHEVSREEIRMEGIPTPPHLRIFAELGRGAMGRIHPATDRNLLRHVALKRLDRELAEQPFYRDGFVAEAQITGQLEHPNIVPVHELSIDPNGVPYFTMKLVEGESFARWLNHASRPPGSTDRIDPALDVLLKVCDAVAYAHHRGVLHRDLKPENVMVGSFGQVYLMDWGLSRLTKTRPASGASAQMEAPGPVGTPEYMAPEQARGNPAEMTERSDVFGLGAILYEIVSGKRPYGEAPNQDVVLERARQGAVVPIGVATAGLFVSKRLLRIVEKATAADPAQRYESPTALGRDIQDFLRGELHLPRKFFLPGACIIREGDVGDAAYMIVSGTCRAFRQVGDKVEPLATMNAGDVFGEMALLMDEPRAASVEAVSAVTVLVLDKATLAEGLGLTGWTAALVHALAQRFRDLERQVRNSGMLRS
ncbi:MAG TPA: protein kinase [Polyangiaceae bacterium]|nr:protein kinase [Polyangiaceae bacterium]